jgi:hypothetical protein
MVLGCKLYGLEFVMCCFDAFTEFSVDKVLCRNAFVVIYDSRLTIIHVELVIAFVSLEQNLC